MAACKQPLSEVDEDDLELFKRMPREEKIAWLFRRIRSNEEKIRSNEEDIRSNGEKIKDLTDAVSTLTVRSDVRACFLVVFDISR
jgi:hypothetical protein